MSLVWFAIVAMAGSVLFVCIHLAELSQKGALERLSEPTSYRPETR
jgi:hypothetical protein